MTFIRSIQLSKNNSAHRRTAQIYHNHFTQNAANGGAERD